MNYSALLVQNPLRLVDLDAKLAQFRRQVLLVELLADLRVLPIDLLAGVVSDPVGC